MTGDELRERRLALGLSQAALAGILGLDVMTVSRWERGARSISMASVVDLALQQLEGPGE